MKKIAFVLAAILISSVYTYADQTVYVEKDWFNYNYIEDHPRYRVTAQFTTTAPTTLTPGETFYAQGTASRSGYNLSSDARPGGEHACPEGVACGSSFVFGHPGIGYSSSSNGGVTGSGTFTAPSTPGTYKMGFTADFSKDPIDAGFCTGSTGSQTCGVSPYSYAEIDFTVSGTACSDSLNNDGAQGADSADPQCHSDCNVNNAASYVPTHTSETTQVGSCPAPTLNLTGRSASLFKSFVGLFTKDAIAQESAQTVEQKNSNGGVIASVGVYSGAVKELKLNTLEAGFTLKSDLGTQGGVLYGLVIKKKDTQDVVDTVAGEEVLTLKYAEYVYKTLSYTAPVTLHGEHDVYLVVTTDSNIPLATRKLGTYTFTKSRDTNSFIKECSFDTKAFTATCIAGNRDKVSPTDTFLAVDTREGGLFGPLAKVQKIVPLTFDAKGFATVTLPLSQKTGTHALDITLVQGQTPLSHRAFDYTIFGKDVSIDNVFIKQENKKDFSIGVVSLSPSLDVKTVAVLLTKKGKELAQESGAYTRPRTDVSLSYKGFSQPDQVVVKILDTNGAVLVEKILPYASPFEKNTSAAAGWGGIIVLAIIALGYIVSLLRKKS